jgi:lauroyl/myristoyl acyltransferase
MAKPSLLSRLRSVRSGHANDFRKLGFLSSGYLLTLLLPRRLDPWVVGRLLRMRFYVRNAWIEKIVRGMQRYLAPALPEADLDSLAREYCAMAREIEWLRFRAYHTRKLEVETSVEGLEILQRARDSGQGAILWGMSFCEHLPVKVALQRSGVELVHLTSAYHGVPDPCTSFGMEVVGPFFCAAESPFVGERVIIPRDGSLGYMRVLMSRLSENACVYIRGDYRSFRNNLTVRLFGRDLPFAPGAPGLAWKLGSPLLPLHVIREGPFRYKAVIHPPIDAERDQGKGPFIRDSMARFRDLVERCILESPSSWEMLSVMERLY